MALKDNLVSYWKLEESSGTRVDAHGSNDLADNNTVLPATGKIDTAADFERDNSEYLNIASSLGIDGGSISFACWVKIESAPVGVDGDRFVFIAQANGTGNQNEHLFEYVDSSGLKLRATRLRMGIGVDPRLDVVKTLTIGTWFHVVMTYDSGTSTLRLYADGSDIGNTSGSNAAGSFDDGTNSGIGAQTRVPQSHVDGIIDEVAVWARAITSDEVTEIYNSGNGLGYDSWDVVTFIPRVTIF